MKESKDYGQNIISDEKLQEECKIMAVSVYVGIKEYLDDYFLKADSENPLKFSKEDYVMFKEIIDIIKK